MCTYIQYAVYVQMCLWMCMCAVKPLPISAPCHCSTTQPSWKVPSLLSFTFFLTVLCTRWLPDSAKPQPSPRSGDRKHSGLLTLLYLLGMQLLLVLFSSSCHGGIFHMIQKHLPHSLSYGKHWALYICMFLCNDFINI